MTVHVLTRKSSRARRIDLAVGERLSFASCEPADLQTPDAAGIIEAHPLGAVITNHHPRALLVWSHDDTTERRRIHPGKQHLVCHAFFGVAAAGRHILDVTGPELPNAAPHTCGSDNDIPAFDVGSRAYAVAFQIADLLRQGVRSTTEIQRRIAGQFGTSVSTIRYDATRFIDTHRIPAPPDEPAGWTITAVGEFILDYESIAPLPSWPGQH